MVSSFFVFNGFTKGKVSLFKSCNYACIRSIITGITNRNIAQPINRRATIPAFTTTKVKVKWVCTPDNKSRQRMINSDKGFILNNIMGKPLRGMGKTTGVTYITNCITKGIPLPTSLYKVPMGVRSKPMVVPVNINDRNTNGNSKRLHPGYNPKMENVRMIKRILIMPLNTEVYIPETMIASRGKLILANKSLDELVLIRGDCKLSMKIDHRRVPEKTYSG